MLVADCEVSQDGVTFATAPYDQNNGWSELPAHRNGSLPAGGNEAFIDGSATWIKASQMYFLDTWMAPQEFFFYQDDLGALNLYANRLQTIH
jgi:hypothetical protein